ncbi:MAG: carbohydrate ABC transporter permease [Spirochaetia bacterium]|nr:carbohydrate ABC transporter permease [Spirochaetia bacterium]MCF7946900.1 carbohydrate ABC transporter permease [Spirochaetia bacterium]
MTQNDKRFDRIKAAILICIGIIFISPLFLMIVSSLKDDRLQIMEDIGSIKAFWVSNPTLNNFVEILNPSSLQNFGMYFRNSVIILALTAIGTIVISSMAGYTLLRGRMKMHKILLPVIISLYIIPLEAIMLPLLYQSIKMGLIDTFVIQILPFIASPMYIFLFYQFMKQVPHSIGEAAFIEGASFWRVYKDIYLPINTSAIATVAILQGMDSWNQYFWPLLVTQSDRVRPISVAIASFSQVGTIYWDRLMAASVLMMLPVLIFFLIFQRFFIASIASSAVKG